MNQRSRGLLIPVWVLLLLASALPQIIAQEVMKLNLSTDFWYTFAAISISLSLLSSYIWKHYAQLRPFFTVFLVLVLTEWFVYTRLDQLQFYQSLLNNPSFNIYMPAEQSLRLIVTVTMIVTLLIMKKRKENFFLTIGDTDAQTEPVKWLNINQGTGWRKLGRNFSIILSLETLTFLLIASYSPVDSLSLVLPFIPSILLSALLNAFNEEVTYKASFLSVLEGVVGKNQALLLMSVYFGLFHYYGIPYGVIGVLMAGFLGWFLGKSMLETRGIFWAWLIHFFQDVLIFIFLALGSITPGGS